MAMVLAKLTIEFQSINTYLLTALCKSVSCLCATYCEFLSSDDLVEVC